MNDLDLDIVFDSLPHCSVLVSAEAPNFTIAAVTDCYTDVTFTKRTEIIGQRFFDVFSDNPDPQKAQGIHNLIASFHQVIKQQPHEMAAQKYDVYCPQKGNFEEKYWDVFNKPIHDQQRRLKHILHNVTDVTVAVKLTQANQQMAERRSKGEEARGIANKSQTGVALFCGSYLAVNYINDVMLQFLGRSKEEVIGRPGLTIFSKYHSETDLASVLLEVYTTKKHVHLNGVTLWAADNKKYNNNLAVSKYLLDISFEPMVEASGLMYGVAAFFTKAH